MKISLSLFAAVLFTGVLTAAHPLLGQGSLTPPGAPGPTMKTLDQVEARLPIPGGTSTATYQINLPGSYYLTGNLTMTGTMDAIAIQADQVTLDLNGYTISSTSTAAAINSAVLINGSRTNVTIRNGHVQSTSTLSGVTFTSTGFFNGVFCSSGAHNVQVENLSVQGTKRGIYLALADHSGGVERCQVSVAEATGITAQIVRGCSAINCGSSAVSGDTGSGVVSECYGVSISGNGVEGSLVTACVGASTSGRGVSASVANQCSGSTGTGVGVSANIAVACFGTASGTGGVAVSAANKYNMP